MRIRIQNWIRIRIPVLLSISFLAGSGSGTKESHIIVLCGSGSETLVVGQQKIYRIHCDKYRYLYGIAI
jgi:hypothetical protein